MAVTKTVNVKYNVATILKEVFRILRQISKKEVFNPCK